MIDRGTRGAKKPLKCIARMLDIDTDIRHGILASWWKVETIPTHSRKGVGNQTDFRPSLEERTACVSSAPWV